MYGSLLWIAAIAACGDEPYVSPLPDAPEGLVVRLWADSTRHRMFDPLFVRITVTNTTEMPIAVGEDVCGMAEYKLFADPFSYTFQTPDWTPASVAWPMQPGEEWIVRHDVLPFPPITIFNHDFWKDVLRAGTADVKARVASEFVKREHWSLVRAELPLRVDVRSEAETSFLESLYDEMRRRKEEPFATDDASRPRERRCPSLHGFGLRDFTTYEDLTQRLFEYEENLSPGPLRDIVHVTRLMRAVYDETDQAKKVQAVYAVMRFVDTLPQIEQENLLMRIIDWWPHLSDDPAYFLLAESALRRLPKNIYQYKDYAAHKREGWSKENPEFGRYIDTVKHLDELIEPEAELKLAPKKESPDSDDPFRDPDG